MRIVARALGMELTPSASRTVFEARGLSEKKEERMTPEELWDLQWEIFDLKVRNDDREDFVADRTILDHYAYCLIQAGPAMTDVEAKLVEEKVWNHMLGEYDGIVYFEHGLIPPEKDGVRETRESYQTMIDLIIRGFLGKYLISYYAVPMGTPEERARAILKHFKIKPKRRIR